MECEYKQVDALGLAIGEFGYILLLILMIGPLKVFLKIKEGKTSVQKLVEDYEDERGFMDDIIAQNRGQPRGGLLPTTTQPQQRVHARTETNESELT